MCLHLVVCVVPSVAFLLSVCMSVWSMASICMSLVVCWLFQMWFVDLPDVLCFSSAFIFF